MAKNDIGGFFVSLGLNPDKNSFETGQKLVGGMTDSLNKLIGTARNAAVVIAAQKAITGAINESGESLQKLHTAERLGITAEKLNVWRAAAKIAGADANSLVASMSKIADVQARLKWDDSGVVAFSQQLSKLRIGYQEIKDLSSDEALKYIFQKAEAMKGEMTTAEITAALEDIAGSGAADLFLELQRQGKTFNQFYEGAAATQYQNTNDMLGAATFATEMKTLGATVDSVKNSVIDAIASKLAGPAATLNKWLSDHQTDISNGIEKIGTATEKLVTKIGDWWEKNGDTMLSVLESILGGVSAMFAWTVSEKGKGFFGGIKQQVGAAIGAVKDISKSLYYGDGQTLQIIQDRGEQFFDGVKSMLGIEDGIIRPDGRVTKIAPDDWVFATRDVSDLAKAFIPQGMAAVNAPAEYSIVQNFTITGASDIPQVLKQQAYRGTQEGLMAIMQQSSQRLQMMSGTR